MDRANLHVPTLQNQHLSVHGQSFHSIATHSRLLWSEFPMPYQFIYTFSVCVSKDKSSWVNDLVFTIKNESEKKQGMRSCAPSCSQWDLGTGASWKTAEQGGEKLKTELGPEFLYAGTKHIGCPLHHSGSGSQNLPCSYVVDTLLKPSCQF